MEGGWWPSARADFGLGPIGLVAAKVSTEERWLAWLIVTTRLSGYCATIKRHLCGSYKPNTAIDVSLSLIT